MTASLPEKSTSLESILNTTDPLDPLVMKVLDDISKEGVPPNVEDFAEFEEYQDHTFQYLEDNYY